MSGERLHLTSVQWLILERLALGETDREIAAALWLTPRTLSRHLTTLYRGLPLGAATNRRTAAALWYFRQREGPGAE